jgi:hypothetical protein
MMEWHSTDSASIRSSTAATARDEIPTAAGVDRGSRARWEGIRER